MGKRLKRGKTGNATQYLTRNQAIKKLQLRLSEFRRLCILKGIHPREPKKKVHGANKTYYHVKDILWLLHEPILNTLRQQKVQDRKVRKAKAKKNFTLAKRLLDAKPTYKLDHLVKERYPSFIDALRDLDDPLTLIHLFATLPSHSHLQIPASAIELSRRLSLEWQAYVVQASALRKVFVSVKGFYFQAEIQGQSVTWLVPHQLSQLLPIDVDYKVMLTFLEFYQTLLQFVHFKVYHNLGLKYPPKVDPRLEEAAVDLAAIMRDLAGLQGDVAKAVASDAKPKSEMAIADAPEIVQRLSTLKDKMKAIVAEDAEGEEGGSGSEGGEGEEGEGASGDEEDEEDGDMPEIDSGDEEVSSDDDEDGGDDDEEEEEDDEASASGDDDDERGSHHVSDSGPASISGEAAVDEGVRAAGNTLGVHADDEASICASLFKGQVFFLAREVPQEPLLLVIRAFGGIAAWDGEGSPFKENDECITHQIVDRPTQGHKFLSREYVQPQWVFDSANFRVLMPCDLYIVGKVPPPHLSPFVDNDEEGYTPEFALTVRKLQEAAKAARIRSAEGGEHKFVGEKEEEDVAADTKKALDQESIEEAYVQELTKEMKKASKGSDEDGDSEDHDENDEGLESQEEEEEERPKKRKAENDEDELHAMKDIMMSRRVRNVYGRIKRAQEGKRQRVEVLEQRKKALTKK